MLKDARGSVLDLVRASKLGFNHLRSKIMSILKSRQTDFQAEMRSIWLALVKNQANCFQSFSNIWVPQQLLSDVRWSLSDIPHASKMFLKHLSSNGCPSLLHHTPIAKQRWCCPLGSVSGRKTRTKPIDSKYYSIDECLRRWAISGGSLRNLPHASTMCRKHLRSNVCSSFVVTHNLPSGEGSDWLALAKKIKPIHSKNLD